MDLTVFYVAQGPAGVCHCLAAILNVAIDYHHDVLIGQRWLNG